MELILWRHADAVDSQPDLDRPLTEKGLKQAERMASFLHKRIPQDTKILVSPAKRAQQTAQALSKNFTTTSAIAPNCSVDSLLKAANWPEGNGCVLLVGHQPVLGEAIAQLLCNSHDSFSVKKGAVWWLTGDLEDENQHASLRLTIAPDLL